VDGFRVDTAKHVDRAFFRAWVPKILAAARRVA
jgi:glycosidase